MREKVQYWMVCFYRSNRGGVAEMLLIVVVAVEGKRGWMWTGGGSDMSICQGPPPSKTKDPSTTCSLSPTLTQQDSTHTARYKCRTMDKPMTGSSLRWE